MNSRPSSRLTGLILGLSSVSLVMAQGPAAPPLPEIHQLMRAVQDHQKQVEQMRENFTYTSLQTTQYIDSGGQVTKTETEEREEFFVNGHPIDRTIKKNGQSLSAADQQKETERLTKLVEKAQKIPYGEPLDSPAIRISRMLEIMDVRNPRREIFRGRPTILFDFIGRKNADTHGLAEDATKELQGTIWIDEADLQVAHFETTFNDNFRVAGGLLANIDKGSSMSFDQAPVKEGLWLPTGADATMEARVLLFKTVHQHVVQRDYDFKSFHVEARQRANTQAPTIAKP